MVIYKGVLQTAKALTGAVDMPLYQSYQYRNTVSNRKIFLRKKGGKVGRGRGENSANKRDREGMVR